MFKLSAEHDTQPQGGPKMVFCDCRNLGFIWMDSGTTCTPGRHAPPHLFQSCGGTMAQRGRVNSPSYPQNRALPGAVISSPRTQYVQGALMGRP
jgi:hypothetical protein